jgi:hypothetical protein
MSLRMSSRMVSTVNQIPNFERVRGPLLFIQHSSAVMGTEQIPFHIIPPLPQFSLAHATWQKMVNIPPVAGAGIPRGKETRLQKASF